MPSFDTVSDVDRHELTNAVDQANRELGKRFDFRNVDAGFELDDKEIRQHAPSEFQLEQMLEVLRGRLIARGIDARCLDPGPVESNLAGSRQVLKLRLGIEQANAKKIVGLVKAAKLKVDTQIQGDKVRVSAKKRDDLQSVIALLRAAELDIPLQFENFRD